MVGVRLKLRLTVLGPCHSQQVPTSRVRSLTLRSRKRQAHPPLGQLKGPSKEAGEHLGAGGGKAADELRHHLPYLSLHRYISLATL